VTKTVYLRLFDPDDPSAPDKQDELPIDNNSFNSSQGIGRNMSLFAVQR